MKTEWLECVVLLIPHKWVRSFLKNHWSWTFCKHLPCFTSDLTAVECHCLYDLGRYSHCLYDLGRYSHLKVVPGGGHKWFFGFKFEESRLPPGLYLPDDMGGLPPGDLRLVLPINSSLTLGQLENNTQFDLEATHPWRLPLVCDEQSGDKLSRIWDC